MSLSSRVKKIDGSFFKSGEDSSMVVGWGAIATAAVLIGLLGLQYPIQQPSETLIQLLLSTATIAATVLAIVFSVTFVGFQQVTNSYVQRAAESLTQDRLFRVTFALFGVVVTLPFASVVFAPFLARVLPASVHSLYSVGVTVSLSLGIVAGTALIVYIERIFQRAAPGELIDLLLQTTLSPSRIFGNYPNGESLRSELTHPLQPLYSLSINAVRNEDPTTARQGVNGIEKASVQVYNQIYECGFEDPIAYGAEFSEPVVGKFLKNILVEASQRDTQTVIEGSCETVESIERSAVDGGIEDIVAPSIKGLGEAIIESDAMGDNRYVVLYGGETAIDIAEHAVGKCEAEVLIDILYPLSHPYTILLRRDVDEYYFKRRFSEFCSRDFPRVFETALEAYEDEIQEKEPERNVRNTATGSSTEAIALNELIEERKALSQTETRYFKRNRESPRETSPSFDGWFKMLKAVVETDLLGLGTRLGAVILVCAYETEEVTNEHPSMFIDTLARIQLNYQSGGTVVANMFRAVSEGDLPTYIQPSQNGRKQPLSSGEGFIQRIQEMMKESEQEETPFQSWLSTVEEDVRERREFLEENYEWDYSPKG